MRATIEVASTSSAPAIVELTRSAKPAFANVSAVLGSNGVGKTTLNNTISGIVRNTAGEIHFDGRRIDAQNSEAIVAAGLIHVPEGRRVFPNLTVRENLILGTFANRTGSGRITDWVFELFPILHQFLDRAGGNLSGGQQQQLAIARTLLSEPKIILLDEPTEGIQPNIVEQIEQVLIDLNRRHGKTIVLVEQNVKFARRASDHFVVMDRGSIAAQGPINALTDQIIQQHLAV